MVYRGRVENGVVVLEAGVKLREGATVRVEPDDPSQATEPRGGPSLNQTLLKFAGAVDDLPSDAARNHDHYLYGAPKR